jgi:hypothetical protein
MHPRAMGLKHLRYQQAELTIAQDGHALAFGDFDLVENLTSSGNGLDENGVFVRDRGGHSVQVTNRQREEFAKCSRMPDDAEDGPSWAVAAEAALAPIAMSAGEVDFASHSFPNPRLVGGVCYFTNEFVAGRAGKAVVSALKFEIRRTDSGGQHANPGESLWHARQSLMAKTHTAGFEVNG